MKEIVVCASNPVVRAGLTAIVTTGRVVGEVESTTALFAFLDVQKVDLAVVARSTLSLLDCDRLLDLLEPSLANEALSVLLLLKIADDLPDALVRRLMATGQVSILPLDVSADGLADAMGAIAQGFNVLHPSITELLFDRSDSFVSNELVTEIEPLTSREGEVLNLVASGLANKAIAQSLSISEHTVKFHVSTILSKLNVSSRTEAVSVGIRAGIVIL